LNFAGSLIGVALDFQLLIAFLSPKTFPAVSFTEPVAVPLTL
jgi:hypothetical protein